MKVICIYWMVRFFQSTALKLHLNVTLLPELKLSLCPPAAHAKSADGSWIVFAGTEPELDSLEHQAEPHAAVGSHHMGGRVCLGMQWG